MLITARPFQGRRRCPAHEEGGAAGRFRHLADAATAVQPELPVRTDGAVSAQVLVSPITRAGTPATIAWSGTSRGDHRAGADQRAGADRDAGDDGRVGADRGRAPDARGLDLPIGFALQAAVAVGRARVAVVGEHHAVTDEDFVLDHDAFADEAVRRDLAAGADDGVLLDLDEGTDFGVVADRAAVEIHQRGLKDLDVLAQLNAFGDRHGRAARCTSVIGTAK